MSRDHSRLVPIFLRGTIRLRDVLLRIRDIEMENDRKTGGCGLDGVGKHVLKPGQRFVRANRPDDADATAGSGLTIEGAQEVEEERHNVCDAYMSKVC